MRAKLDKNNVEDILPLTGLQEGMLFHYMLTPDSLDYHEQISISLAGDIKIDLLQKAWDFVIEQNEMLRSVFRWKGIDKPIQAILKNHKVVIKEYDFSNEDIPVRERLIQDIKSSDFRSRINLENETLRVYLCKCSNNEYNMIISNHHILYDGWSNAIIIKELLSAYRTLYRGMDIKLLRKSKFKEYIKLKQSNVKADQQEYWEKYLHGVEQSDILINNVCISELKEHSHYISKEMTSNIIEFAKKNGVSAASLLYSAWGILLQRLNNTDDIMFGTTVSGRNVNISGIENMVGLFINTIPVRVHNNKEETIIQFIERISKTLTEKTEFESTPLVDIKKYSGINNNLPLFNSLMVVENYPIDSSVNQDETISIKEFSAEERTNYNLVLAVTMLDSIKIDFKYNCFTDDGMIIRIGQYLENIISFALSNNGSKVAEIDFLPEEERKKLLYEFNDTYADYPKGKTLHQLFEEQAEKVPDNTAVMFNNKYIRYRDLNSKSNQLARVLRSKGVSANSIVGLIVDRSIDMIIGILGILKAGGAYLPIDPDYPEDRIKFILSDSGADIFLTQSWLKTGFDFDKEFLNLDDNDFCADIDDTNLDLAYKSNDLAYVIYTSGSTGRPKGVMIEHRGIVNHSYVRINRFKLNQYDREVMTSSIGFDVSVEQVFSPLLCGASIYIPDKDVLFDSLKIVAFMRDNAITYLNTVPSFLEHLSSIDDMPSLKRVAYGGEVCSNSLLKKLFANTNCEFYNAYGPTEVSVACSMYFVKPKDIGTVIPIGDPFENNRFYILDTAARPSPIGIAGELYIGGIGLARGYLNRPELTAEKFIENPLMPGELVYRTGDLVKWLPDGNVEFVGRVDNQVKIRGFRVELGEIESRLLEFDGVKEVVVLAKDSGLGDKCLCAYVISEKELLIKEFREYLTESLPDYMIPAYFVKLDVMPLNASGKIDRKALPEPEVGAGIRTEYVAPRDQIEANLASIWSEILGVDKIGIHDNFFELGGHSLKGTVLASRIHKELNIELPIKELFKFPTISGISEYLNNAKKSRYFSIKPIEERDCYESSFAQKRLWVINQLQPDSSAYNISGFVTLLEKVDSNVIENVFKKLFERHEAFRTRFEERDGIVIQIIEEKVNFNMQKQDISMLSPKEKEKERKVAQEELSSKIFNLKGGSLIAVRLTKIEENEYDIIFCMHHIISDGWSTEVLRREFFLLYDAYKRSEECDLSHLAIQYKDFSAWQNKLIENEEFAQAAKAFWGSQLSGEIPVLKLPFDYPAHDIDGITGSSYTTILTEDRKDKLNELATASQVSLFALMLTIAKVYLSNLTEQSDILIGMATFGRNHVDLQNVIGHFVNATILRSEIKKENIFYDIAKEISENTLNALEYQNFPLELVIEELKIRYPKISVFFNMLNFDEGDGKDIESFEQTHVEKIKDVKFDLEWYITEHANGIQILCTYNNKLFEPSTIEYIMKKYHELVDKILEDPYKPLRDYFSSDKKKRLRS